MTLTIIEFAVIQKFIKDMYKAGYLVTKRMVFGCNDARSYMANSRRSGARSVA